MNVEIGTEAARFPEKKYINGIFVAVWVGTHMFCLAVVVSRPVSSTSCRILLAATITTGM
jgi:hypothetical protein